MSVRKMFLLFEEGGGGREGGRGKPYNRGKEGGREEGSEERREGLPP